MLTGITFRRFRSFQDARLPIGQLTVLIGPNATGKSNAIEALRLLSWISRGPRLTDLPYALRSGELAVRGDAAELVRRPSDDSWFELEVVLGPQPNSGLPRELSRLEHRLRLMVEGAEARVLDEELEAPNAPGRLPLFSVETPAMPDGAEMRVAYNNFARGGKKPTVPVLDRQPAFVQLTSPARLASSGHKESARLIPPACRHLQDTLSNTLFLDAVPGKMRGWPHRDEVRLQQDGGNVSAVLHRLVEVEHRKEEVLAFVQALPEQDFLDIDFDSTPRDEVMVKLRESFGGRESWVPAALLSDGTLRVLAIAAAMLSSPPGSLVVIEEIDNGVHPPRARMLMEQIERNVRGQGPRVLLTTHNPALMDALSNQALRDVVACHRDRQTGESRLSRLGDLPRFASLTAQGPLGRLVTDGTLEKALLSSAEAPVDPHSWLASLLASEPS